MENVIQFSDYRTIPPLSYLVLVRETLSDEDYQDFLEACIDNESYQNLDNQMKEIVDSYMLL